MDGPSSRLAQSLEASKGVGPTHLQITNPYDTDDYIENTTYGDESDGSDQTQKENPNKFLPGIESVKCFICHLMYKTEPKGGENYEHPLTLHCGHTFGAKCLTKWVNENVSNDVQCPICRGPTYKRKKSTRSIDMSIETLVFSLDPENRAAQIEAFKVFSETKLSNLKQDPRVPEQIQLTDTLMVNCILNCIWLYLTKAVETAHSEDRCTKPYKEAIEAVELLLRKRVDSARWRMARTLWDLITIALNQTPKLTMSRMERLKLSQQLLEGEANMDSKTAADELPMEQLFNAAQMVPRMLYCFWKARDTSFCDNYYEVDVEALFEADLSRGNVDGIWADEICVGQTFTADHIRFVLKSWGIREAHEWETKECVAQDERLFLKIIKAHWIEQTNRWAGQPFVRTRTTNSQGNRLLDASQG